MTKNVDRMSKDELIQELYHQGQRVTDLEAGLRLIRDMTEKAGANEHARYCFETATQLVGKKEDDNGNQEQSG